MGESSAHDSGEHCSEPRSDYGSAESSEHSIAAVASRRRWPFIVAGAYLVLVLGVGLTVYPSAPDPMPVHFNGSFEADAWAEKNLLGFLAPVFIGFGVTLLMALLAAVLPAASTLGSKQRSPQQPSDAATQLSPRPPTSVESARLARRMLENLSIAVAVLIGTTALLTWFGVPEWANPWVAIVLIGSFFGVVAASVVPIIRSERRAYGLA